MSVKPAALASGTGATCRRRKTNTRLYSMASVTMSGYVYNLGNELESMQGLADDGPPVTAGY